MSSRRPPWAQGLWRRWADQPSVSYVENAPRRSSFSLTNHRLSAPAPIVHAEVHELVPAPVVEVVPTAVHHPIAI